LKISPVGRNDNTGLQGLSLANLRYVNDIDVHLIPCSKGHRYIPASFSGQADLRPD